MANPFNFGTPVPPDKFVGRWDQVNAIADDLANSEGHSYAVIGGRRFGKSSFLEALQHVLLARITQIKTGDWYAFPVGINLKRLEQANTEGVFGLMLNTLHEYFTVTRLRNELGVTLQVNLTDTGLDAFVKGKRKACGLEEFKAIIDQFLNVFPERYSLVRLAFLIDETEAAINQAWTESLFDKLRSLVYEGALRKYVRLVMAGSSEMIEVKQSGSPLLNMLKLIYLEAFSQDQIREIVGWAEHVSPEIADIVFQQSGGHPFIAQYLMHYAWEKGMAATTPEMIATIATQFKHERHADLYKWQQAIGVAGQWAYKVLEENPNWLTEDQIRAFINHPDLSVDCALTDLRYHGFAIHDGTWQRFHYQGDLFKHWFADHVLPSLNIPQGSTTPLPNQKPFPNVTIVFKDRVFPTVYCYSLTKQAYPLVTCQIDNTAPHCQACRISVEAEIQGFSDLCTDTIEVASGQQKVVELLPLIRYDARLELNDIRRVACRVIVSRHETVGLGILHDVTYDLQLHAADTALLAVVKTGGGLTDLTDHLSVFVTPHVPEIKQLLRSIADKHPERMMVGYQGDATKARRITQSQAKAIFDTLKKQAQIVYTNTPLNFGKERDQITQRVRLPKDSLLEKQANCIDGTVLFASLLELIGIEPVIVIVPGHAFVGWRIWRNRHDYDFLETTMIGTASFGKALRSGNTQYRNAYLRGFHTRSLFDPHGFMRIVYVAECRKQKIFPLM